MTLLGFKTILHKKCRSGKNSEGPAENSWVLIISYYLFIIFWLKYLKKNNIIRIKTTGPSEPKLYKK
jgi:hypothetical protein